MNSETKPRWRIASAVTLGVLYGLALRIGFGWAPEHRIFEIISVAFLVGCPFSVGAVAVAIGAAEDRVSIGRQIQISIISISVFLVATYVTFLEGLICLVLAAPLFLVAAILGGLTAGYLHNLRYQSRSTLSVFAILPILIAPIEASIPHEPTAHSVTTSIQIDSPPEKVFRTLATVRDIREEELGFTFVHLIGLPKPLEAEMSCNGVGCTRTSRWEKDVWFQEVITEWKPSEAIRYRFIIPKGGIPREALDQHVEIGGAYFQLIDGGYEVFSTSGGGTNLSLTTRFRNKSLMNRYGAFWGRLVLNDFHRSILRLLKNRAEHDA